MKNLIIYLALILTLNGCSGGNSCPDVAVNSSSNAFVDSCSNICPVYYNSTASQFTSPGSYNPYDNRILYTEETPSACYEHALDFIVKQNPKTEDENGCPLYPKIWKKVEQVDSKLINTPETLILSEVEASVKKFCSDYSISKDTSLDSFSVDEDTNEITFHYEYDDNAHYGKLNFSEIYELACPLHQISCYTQRDYGDHE